MEPGKIMDFVLKEGTNRLLRQPTEQESQEEENHGNNRLEVKAADPQVEQLAERVEQANMADVVKVTHEALAEVMLGWKGEGKVGDNCPKLIITIPCSVKDHRPV